MHMMSMMWVIVVALSYGWTLACSLSTLFAWLGLLFDERR